MTDQELADAIVALGVAAKAPCEKDWWLYYIQEVVPGLTAKNFVRDWRVAGAMMEKIEAEGYDFIADVQSGKQPIIRTGRWSGERCSTENTKGAGKDESLPRAIIEACVEALK